MTNRAQRRAKRKQPTTKAPRTSITWAARRNDSPNLSVTDYLDRASEIARFADSAEFERAAWDLMPDTDSDALILASFLSIANHLPDRFYWSELQKVWRLVALPFPYTDIWRVLFTSPRGSREFLMSAEDRRRLDELANELTVYRGVGHESCIDGMTWTVDRELAETFARTDRGVARWPDGTPVTPTLVTGRAVKRDVLGCFEVMGGTEVVLCPESVEVLAAEPLAGYGMMSLDNTKRPRDVGASGAMAQEG